MGLFSKLIKDAAKIDHSTIDRLKEMAQDAVSQAAAKAAQPAQSAQPARAARPTAASGFSWGDEMPAEENQYNYPGRYDVYFEALFSAAYPAFTLTKSVASGGAHPATVFTFSQNGRKALVVELLSEKSSVQKLRRACAAEGVPYLRFYYDHPGWWNTKAYVLSRTDAALGK